MPEIQKWADIKEPFIGGALLLGNGASMAVHKEFGYASLRVAAEEHGHLTPEVASIFRSFDTSDFELVLRRLWEATLVNKALGVEPGRVEEAYQQVRQALISTVRQVHISYEDASQHFEPMFQFMKTFDTVLSLNYDLLVYWAMMASQPHLGNWFKDCFLGGGLFCEDWEDLRKPYRADGSTLVFYPHGSLITARKRDYSEKKLTLQGGGGDNLLERILALWESGAAVPLFVSEGTTEYKRKSIASSSYLSRVFREVLPSSGESLVIYGWAASEQDEHVLAQLRRSGTRLRRVAASVYRGDQASAQKMEDALKAAGVEEVLFFDAESPGCWIHPQDPVDS
ncbi:uncharacterized protein DUF4917 [Aquabacterium commune]|uniref:Uncharacterized protein DUF4917 n=1 Tax=Aquabacterium commune TaxID=70586 RepID=A0A4R6R6T0_9BURK|nr:DUF4917 family protein [Aquabacterium commune]TDP81579.1 uncharacterized protein DUF4917 [Aquabacterium commune]